MIRSLLFFTLAAILLTACGSSEPASPLQTFKTYSKALKQKDTSSIKLLLSADSLKMLEQEAKAMNSSIDDVIKRETLIAPDQTTVEYKNEKIEGNKATLEVKNPYGTFDVVPFVKEDNQWKIDMKGYADRLGSDIDESDKKLDQMSDQGREP